MSIQRFRNKYYFVYEYHQLAQVCECASIPIYYFIVVV